VTQPTSTHANAHRGRASNGLVVLWAGLTFLLLCGMTAMMLDRRAKAVDPEDAIDYHQRVGLAIDELPYSFDEWIGVDGTVPEAAVQLLRANRVMSRRFTHLPTGQSVQVLVVHCADSRDLVGHYPPRCYPANGWSARSTEPVDLDTVIADPHPTTLYYFGRGNAIQDREMAVFNFMVLPDGQLGRDMGPVRSASQDYQRKFFGAAQVQILVPPDLERDLQVKLAQRFINLLEPVIREIQSGVR